MRGKSLMIQGTASSVGKSVLVSALLRIMRQDGLRVAPFKAQNMALNSFVTREGLEMGRAQATQAQAAGLEPSASMNPVLLKPTSDRRSQVIVSGRPVGTMTAAEYHREKPKLRALLRRTYEALEETVDCVIIEGAGSPAEINLREGDIVNMSMAEAADAPVILVGDINLGGVFASLLGTMMLLTDEERARVKGVIINKFRGDPEILRPGLSMLEERIHVPVLGVVPFTQVELEDEDSVTERFERARGEGRVRVAVVQLAHISNFTDFQALTLQRGVSVYYAKTARDLEGADIIILPGTKNTIEDLIDLRRRGMDAPILRHARSGGMVVGICGGYQMLGERICDPEHTESSIPEVGGLGLLPVETVFLREKHTAQVEATVCGGALFEGAEGLRIDGYEIHAGVTSALSQDCVPWLMVDGRAAAIRNRQGNVLGSYLHGLFDSGQLFGSIAAHARALRGEEAKPEKAMTLDEFRETEFDRIAGIVRASVDMEAVYDIMRGRR